MQYIIALISILILGAIVFLLLLYKPKTYLVWLLLITFGSNLAFEASMLTTARIGIHNHNIANVFALVMVLEVLLLINDIWSKVVVHKKNNWVTLIASIGIVTFWFVDNFILHQLSVFNSLSQSINYTIILLLLIYVMNLVLFLQTETTSRKVHSLIVLGLLIYAACNVLVDIFFNYYLDFSNSTYQLIARLEGATVIISHAIILVAIILLYRRNNYIKRITEF